MFAASILHKSYFFRSVTNYHIRFLFFKPTTFFSTLQNLLFGQKKFVVLSYLVLDYHELFNFCLLRDWKFSPSFFKQQKWFDCATTFSLKILLETKFSLLLFTDDWTGWVQGFESTRSFVWLITFFLTRIYCGFLRDSSLIQSDKVTLIWCLSTVSINPKPWLKRF